MALEDKIFVHIVYIYIVFIYHLLSTVKVIAITFNSIKALCDILVTTIMCLTLVRWYVIFR